MDRRFTFGEGVGKTLQAFIAVATLSGSALAYVPDTRWSATASGSTGAQGRPATLTWSIVPDGTSIPNEGASNLISYMDGLFGVAGGGNDLTARPWYSLLDQSFQRWTDLGGLTFAYESHDDGSQLSSAGGVLGVRGDVRVSGAFVDGANGTLAYTYLPQDGDMVVDTGETTFYSDAANNHRQLRNTIMHELGHAFGLNHITSSTDNLLMEPFINTSFDGPQLDDIRGLHGYYGDKYEKANGGAGNESAAHATSLGSIAASGTKSIGSDAVGGQFVAATETDFVSIANSSDVDFYSFTVSSASTLSAMLTPLGGVFSQAAQGGTESPFDANARNNLALSIFAADGATLLGTASSAAAGQIESLTGISLGAAGQYFARVTGADANVQLYQLALSVTSTGIPGDFDHNGLVDGADFLLWQRSDGAAGSNLVADGNGDGTVNAADLALWQSHFGQGSAISGSVHAVPEPASIRLLAAVTAGIFSASRVTRRFVVRS
jgi:serralysin